MSDVSAETRFGVSSMVAPLHRVAMRRPGPATYDADPELWHYSRPLDRERLLKQYDLFATLVEDSGAKIEWIASEDAGASHESEEDGLADSIFPYDPSLMTRDGAILLRPGKLLREPEIVLHRVLYERLGIPVLGEIEAPGTVEGGDCFRVDAKTLAVGRGYRTNQAGIEQLRAILAAHEVSVVAFDLPVWKGEGACLHLLSLISPLDRDLALVYRPLLPVAFYELLREHGITCLEGPEEEFAASSGLSLNVLALAPGRCIALAGFPETARLMTGAGCDVRVFPGDELCIPCEGGPTCMTLPILRE